MYTVEVRGRGWNRMGLMPWAGGAEVEGEKRGRKRRKRRKRRKLHDEPCGCASRDLGSGTWDLGDWRLEAKTGVVESGCRVMDAT